MLTIKRLNFAMVQDMIEHEFSKTKPVTRGMWQGVDVSRKPDMATHELAHVAISVDLRGVTDLKWHRSMIKPNLPWADKHFEERVCGYPINPGVEWANWPWGGSADKFRDENGMFNHNYMERYWPKYAGHARGATKTAEEFSLYMPDYMDPHFPNSGIRHEYGDLNDVVGKLASDPGTRQAVLPIYFPEDTALKNARQPCSIYYHFIRNGNALDVVYAMRSCDFKRHWADDVYLTVRLLLWVIDRLKEDDILRHPTHRQWENVVPGEFVMHIANLHIFAADFIQMYGRRL
jgi:hypothetical protein